MDQPTTVGGHQPEIITPLRSKFMTNGGAKSLTHSAYGRCLQQLGHWEQSVVQFERGLELKPHYCGSDARLMLAESYLKVGSKPKAIREWHIVAGMKPEYPSYEATINAATELLQRNA